jgi:hypothetical protein
MHEEWDEVCMVARWLITVDGSWLAGREGVMHNSFMKLIQRTGEGEV